ncbi:MAG: hypothetical protein KF803_09145 [Cyclobacteriaceae bacterium]|nr:hypothetical protein [Cyclobacteriaceae bacterium]
MKIRKDIIPGLLIVVFVVFGGMIYFKIDMERKREILDSLKLKYPQVSINETLMGEITDIYHGNLELFNNSPNQAYVIINNTTKRRVTTTYSFNERYSLDEVLSIQGLSIYKEMGSDRLIVYSIQNKDSISFIFGILDDLGYPLRTNIE